MKNLLIALMLAWLPGSVAAQHWSFGVSSGLSCGDIRLQMRKDVYMMANAVSDANTSPVAGAFARLQGKRFLISGDLDYLTVRNTFSTVGNWKDEKGNIIYVEHKNRWEYQQAALSLMPAVIIGKNLSFGLGLSGIYAFDRRYEQFGMSFTDSSASGGNYSDKYQIRRLQLSGRAAIAYAVNDRLSASLSVSHSIAPLQPSFLNYFGAFYYSRRIGVGVQYTLWSGGVKK